MSTKIEWTDQTDNIIVVEGGGWWCRKVSPACAHCYAEKINGSPYYGGNKLPYSGQPPKLKLRREFFSKWPRQTKPKKHFVVSMTDVFGEWIARSWHFEMLDAMAAAPDQTFQILTKRANVMARNVSLWLASRRRNMPANIWLGFTAENQECFDQRWAEVRKLLPFNPIIFVSAEPLLGSIKLPADFLALGHHAQVITGGESGPKARPSNPLWFKSLRDQSQRAGGMFFFKQWGEWAPHEFCDWYPGEWAWHKFDDGQVVYRVGKKKTGRRLEASEHNQFPFPTL